VEVLEQGSEVGYDPRCEWCYFGKGRGISPSQNGGSDDVDALLEKDFGSSGRSPNTEKAMIIDDDG
jgi:hypothetical protein